uniref:Uncharacterized protein n=1 Tax=Panagrolaimus davidi TaxID=227884 RepID=A0A914NZC8_9BILA
MHNGTAATLEKVFECFSRVKSFICTSPNITSKTFESLLKIPQFLTILSFWLYSVSEDFDIDSFNIYMKKNKHSKIRLDFCGTVSEAYKNRLNLFVDEIIATENQGYKPPLISCDGLDGEKYGKLYNLYIKNL